MAFFSAGALLDANDVVKRDRLDLKDVPKNLMDDPAWKGKLLMLPSVFEPALIFYNKALFERAGRPDPGQLWAQKRWTWAAFQEAARALHPQSGADGALPHLGYELRTWDGEVFSVVRSRGGDVLSPDRTRFVLDDAAGIDALTQWAEQSARHKITPPAVPLPQGGFDAGRVALRYAVPSNVPTTRTTRSRAQAAWGWDVAPTPTDRSHTPTLFVGGYGIWKNPKQAAQAGTFLKFLMGSEAMLMRAELSARMPSRASLLPEFGKRLNLPQEDPKSLVKAVEESLAGARGLPHTPTFPTWRDMLEKQVLLPILRGDATARDALQVAKPAITAELQKGG
jgi:multiple sugar transport system substrate-binding protein